MAYTRTSPLPPVRDDINAVELAPGMVLLYDDDGYAEREVRVPTVALDYLSLMDGARSAEFIARKAAEAGRSFSVDDFLAMVNILDAEHFLMSSAFQKRRAAMDLAFNNAPTRPAAHAGTSYPDAPDELRALLDSFLAEAAKATTDDVTEPIAVVAPHIDFRVGGASYGPAYRALARSTASTFVIFGVAHRASYDSFMICDKDFETPLGVLPADRELIEHFRAALPFGLTRNQIVHRCEHSIEFQAVFLRHIFPDRDIRIVPILTGSLHQYVETGSAMAHTDTRLTTLYDTLRQSAAALNRSVCYVAGADLCHIGRKFGDTFAARSILPEVRSFDHTLLNHAARADADGFIGQLARERNRYRVCGVGPIYATLRTARPTGGHLLCYDQWDEVEQDSAVTFASMAFHR